MRVERDGDRWALAGEWYRLTGTADGPIGWLDDLDGGRWAELRWLAAADTLDGDDETFGVVGPDVDEADRGVRLSWRLAGSRWAAKRLVVTATPGTLALHVELEGAGTLTTVSILGGRVVAPRGSGPLMSGAWFRSIVPAAPGDPSRIVLPATESASIGVVSGSEPGRGRWFYTPAPFVVAASREAVVDPVDLPAGPWLSFALDARRGEAGFTEMAWRALDHGFHVTLDYDGHTRVAGRWSSPPLVLSQATDPYAAIAAQRDRLGIGVGAAPSPTPAWWRQPIFCGWGAQSASAAADGLPMSAAPARSTAASYDAWLDGLERNGIVPGTIVLDDKWQATYGRNEPDATKWPDLRGWIAARHDRGQRVVLWYKAWDPEGLPAAWCVRSAAEVPLAIDPTNPDGAAAIRETVRAMLGPDDLDADGLKIDFTHRTPSGRATLHHGPAWGVDLLATLLETVADEARRLRPDALLVGHTPNPIVAGTVGMIRLNDALRLDDPEVATDIVPQMRYRAAVARAACPNHPIDTDDWCAPDRAGWRAYNAIKADLGVPALYYATHIDRTGERLEAADYELIRRVWGEYRRGAGLPEPG